MKRSKTSFSDVPPPEEWDLTTLPDDELEACTIYEFGRESQELREKAAIYHRALSSRTKGRAAVAYADVSTIQYQVAFVL